MKKLAIVALAAATLGTGLTSCDNAGSTSGKASSDVDSLSMALGVIVGNNFKMYMDQLPGGPGKKDSMIMGFEAGLGKEMAYIIALQNAGQASSEIKARTDQEPNKKILVDAFKRALEGDSTMSMSAEQAMEYFRNYQSPKQQEEARKAAEAAVANKAAGEKFLAENKTKEGVQSTASGLQYKVVTKGSGKTPAATDRVKVNYKGTLIDGTEFDSGNDVVFGVNQVIPGWTEALQLMPVGAKYILYIPSDIAYGDRQMGDKITPNSTLVFEVELVDIEK